MIPTFFGQLCSVLGFCLVLGAGSVLADPGATPAGSDRVADEQAIRAVVANLGTAWTAGDGDGFSRDFAQDSDAVTWFGHHVSGHAKIVEGHRRILSTVYAGTILRVEPEEIRFLGPDVALVYTRAWLRRAGEPEPEQPSLVPLIVMSRHADRWLIEAFQNTPNLSQETTHRIQRESGWTP